MDDAEAIERVRIATWHATYRGQLPDAALDAMSPHIEQRRQRLRDLGGAEFCFVAEGDGRVVGFAVGGPERGHDPDYQGEVGAIYVLPEHQRKGLGRELIRESARHLARNGMTTLLIWVLRENGIGRGFYERLGGRAVREKPLLMPGLGEGYVEVGYGWLDTAALR